MINLAIFASGKGTNAEAIIQYFRENTEISVALIVTGNPKAGVAEVAKKYGIPLATISQQILYRSTQLLETLRQHQIGFIALAGFIWLVPAYIINEFHGKIINIHPALLPKYGGKGMYGRKVHEAVLNGKEKESGITVHHVNERFDEGTIIFQAKCSVDPSDDAASLEMKVRKLELEHYPKVIEKLLIKETVAT